MIGYVNVKSQQSWPS